LIECSSKSIDQQNESDIFDEDDQELLEEVQSK